VVKGSSVRATVLAIAAVGIAGATVSALVNGSVAQSRTTSGNGSYVLPLQYGTYELKATYPGYAPGVVQNFTVHQATSKVFQLLPMTYAVRGVVSDGLTGQPLAGAKISVALPVTGGVTNGTPLATSDQSGAFAFALTNGTHLLYLQGNSSNSAVTYAPLQFTVVINGAPQTRDLTMSPALSTLNGRVVDVSTGLPLAGARVTVIGREDGVPYTRTFVTGADGSFTASLYLGSYLASTVFGGYLASTQTFSVEGPSTSVTFALSPMPTSIATSNAPWPGWAIWGAVGISAAAIGGTARLLGRSGRRGPLAPGTDAPEDPWTR